MADTPIVQSEPKPTPEPAPGMVRVERRTRGPSMTNVLSFVVGLVGIAALCATAWVYAQTQRDIIRISTDIAQIRISIDLYGQRAASAAPAAPDGEGLLELSNRLAILEQSWRGAAAAPAAGPSTLPPLPGENAGNVATGGDCLPTGTRFMVAAGDNYPVCGTTGSVAIAGVDDGFITLGDGTVIAQGGTVGLPGTQCMVGLMPSDGGGISGFAEIRVIC